MNDLEFRQQHLDTKSASFCAAKWYNATIWLGSGQTTSCHHPPAHAIDVEAIMTNPSALHNTDQKKTDRADMLAGQRPPGCEYCWRIEDMAESTGTPAVSDRVYKSRIYPIQALHDARSQGALTDVDLRTLEIAFDRTCQFACSYCNPAFSSTWANDIKKHGAYTDLHSDGRGHFTHAHDSAQLYTINESNPYIAAFFAWWETDLHRTLQELRITGGEPLMSAHTWRLIDWFRENKHKSSTRLAINSNLGEAVDLDRLLASTQHMAIDLYTSCEAVGAQAEYIRSGLVWNAWVRNVETVLESRQFRCVHVMATINALCLTTLDSLLDRMVIWRRAYGHSAVSFTLNILRFPSFQSPLVLPDRIRTHYSQTLRDWAVDNADQLHEHERNHLQRLVDYLDTVKTPHSDSFELEILAQDFHSFYTQYDARRGLNFESAFPELAEWYRTLKGGAV